MGLIRTIVSFNEDKYYALKQQAARKRQSFSAAVREIVEPRVESKVRSKEEVERIMARTRALAKKNAKILKGWNSLKALREIRREN